MKEQSSMGMNRTGVQMSPLDTREMEKVPNSMKPATPGDQSALSDMRKSYIEQSDQVGSIPMPGTFKGAVTAGASMLTGNQPQLLLDKLGERLAFERAGTRLYDALITKLEGSQDNTTSMTLADLQRIRQEEVRHFNIVNEAIQSLGGDPTAQTPCADVTGVASMGIMQVVTDPRTTMAQSLQAILMAEMTDNAGWEMLIAIAQDQGQDSLISDFTVALDEERQHLQLVRNWLEEATIGKAISAGAIVDDIGSQTRPSPLH